MYENDWINLPSSFMITFSIKNEQEIWVHLNLSLIDLFRYLITWKRYIACEILVLSFCSFLRLLSSSKKQMIASLEIKSTGFLNTINGFCLLINTSIVLYNENLQKFLQIYVHANKRKWFQFLVLHLWCLILSLFYVYKLNCIGACRFRKNN